MARENYFVLLGLNTNPPESDESVIKKAIDDKIQSWNGSVKKGIRESFFKERLAMEPDIRAVMLNPTKRRIEAQNAIYDTQRPVDDEFIKTTANKYAAREAVLAKHGLDSLYDFLSLQAPGDSDSTNYSIRTDLNTLDERSESLSKSYRNVNNSEMQRISGYCLDIFSGRDSKDEYDRFLKLKIQRECEEQIEAIYKVNKKITADGMNIVTGNVKRIYFPATEVEKFIRDYCGRKDYSIESAPVKTTPPPAKKTPTPTRSTPKPAAPRKTDDGPTAGSGVITIKSYPTFENTINPKGGKKYSSTVNLEESNYVFFEIGLSPKIYSACDLKYQILLFDSNDNEVIRISDDLRMESGYDLLFSGIRLCNEQGEHYLESGGYIVRITVAGYATKEYNLKIYRPNTETSSSIYIKGKRYTITTTELDLDKQELDDSDIIPLKRLTKLRKLSMSSNNITDISPLRGLINLERLTISNNDISDLSPLKNLTGLRYLSLIGTDVEDLSPLSGLSNLYDICLWGTPISDISPLRDILPNLAFLDIGNCKNLKDVSILKKLPAKTELTVTDTPISNWSAISHVRNVCKKGYSFSDKSTVTAVILGMLLGMIGVQNFYLGKPKRAIFQIICTVVTFAMGGNYAYIALILAYGSTFSIASGIVAVDGEGDQLLRVKFKPFFVTITFVTFAYITLYAVSLFI